MKKYEINFISTGGQGAIYSDKNNEMCLLDDVLIIKDDTLKNT